MTQRAIFFLYGLNVALFLYLCSMKQEIWEEEAQKLLRLQVVIADYGRITVIADEGIMEIKMFLSSICNRAFALNDAFINLTRIDVENYLAAVPLVRLQIDNCLMAYGSLNSGKPLQFINWIAKGRNLTKFVDNNGRRLYESHLVDDLTKVFPDIRTLYKKYSSYVHVSSTLFYSTMKESEESNKKHTHFNIQTLDGHYTDEEKIQFFNDMGTINTYLINILLLKWDNYIKEKVIPEVRRIFKERMEQVEELSLKEKNN